MSFFCDISSFKFNCQFFIDSKTESFPHKSPDQIGCVAEIESYEGKDCNLASFDSTAVEKYHTINEKHGNASTLMKFIGSKPLSEITEVVKIHGHRFKTHPQGIGSTFSNIKSFKLADGDLWRLRKEDLKQFPNQEIFYYNYNKIEYLETDLFIFNPKLQKVDLSRNAITQISQQLGLTQLLYVNYFYLNWNLCTVNSFGCTGTNCNSTMYAFMTRMGLECPEIETGLISEANNNIDSSRYALSDSFDSENLKLAKGIDAQIQQMLVDFSDVERFIQAEAEKTNKFESQMNEMIQNVKYFNQILDNVYDLVVSALEEANQ